MWKTKLSRKNSPKRYLLYFFNNNIEGVFRDDPNIFHLHDEVKDGTGDLETVMDKL
jgi:hypothetical protein